MKELFDSLSSSFPWKFSFCIEKLLKRSYDKHMDSHHLWLSLWIEFIKNIYCVLTSLVVSCIFHFQKVFKNLIGLDIFQMIKGENDHFFML